MEAEMSYSVWFAKWRNRKISDIIQSEPKTLRARETNDVPVSLRQKS
jgi:hypothetical protein